MKVNPGLLTTADEIDQLACELRKHSMIAVDTEFIREQTFFPIVEIIQVATLEQSWLIDAKQFKKNFSAGPRGGFLPAIQPLLEVLKEPSVLKIVHASQADQECIYTSFGVVMTPVLDTSVAASLCGYGDGVGLSRLLKTVLDVTLHKGHARTNWAMRPLPVQLEEYAHADVIHLVKLGKRLLEKLEAMKRWEWALELSAKWADSRLYETDVDAMTLKLSRGARLDQESHHALHELVRWREERVRQLNLPRRWVADDAVLLDLARVRPKSLDHLGTFRGLNKGEIKTNGEQILKLLREAKERSDLPYQKAPRSDVPTASESQVLDLVRCYIGILADRHRIAARHLSTVTELLPLIRNRFDTLEDFVTHGVLTESAAKLIGQELLEFLQGHCSLSIQEGTVQIRNHT